MPPDPAVARKLNRIELPKGRRFMKPTRYADPNRLGDMMALVQYLALGRLAKRCDGKLRKRLGEPTSNAATWADLAENHREFFSVVQPPGTGPSDRNVALIWREALSIEKKGDLEEGIRPPLSPESVAKLLEIALSLHDREVTRKQRLAYLVPIGAVIIAGLFSILGLLIRLYSQLPPSP